MSKVKRIFRSPKMPVDNSAAIAAAQEKERQERIAQGQSAIDSAFGGFNDDFFNQYQNDYTSYYYPQLEDQYGDARKRLTLQLAKTGNLTGSAGINQLSELEKYYDQQRTGITNQALGAVNSLRGDIDQRKSTLYSSNRAAADPGSAASQAASAAASLRPAPPSSPLANTFSDFFNNLGNTMALYNMSGGQGRMSGEQAGVQTFSGGAGQSQKMYQ